MTIPPQGAADDASFGDPSQLSMPAMQERSLAGSESTNVGIGRETAVTPDYTEATSKFTGAIEKMTIQPK